METETSPTNPVRSVLDELDALKTDFRSTLSAYASRIEEELGLIRGATETVANRQKIPAAQLRDLRDMLTLLRKFSIKPDRGRRKDLKKIDDLIGDLTMLIEHW